MNNTALAVRTDTAALMPAMSIQDAVDRYGQLVQFVGALLKVDIDYGQIPGTNKPTLLKPGAEKLLTFFGLTKRFIVLEKVEDWMGDRHGSEPFFYYMYRCALYSGDQLIAESDGSCNSFESKYRYRKADRVCPFCGKASIIKGREEYGGGWVCFKKKDGCGAKFGDADPDILNQQVGRVVNPDIADQVNTIQKMAQKRALIAATLLAVNASEFFTQDLEPDDFMEAGGDIEPEPVRDVKLEGAQPQRNGKQDDPGAGLNASSANGTVRSILSLAKFLGWDSKTLANEVYTHPQLRVSISEKDPARSLEAMDKLQLKTLLQVLQSEKNARTNV